MPALTCSSLRLRFRSAENPWHPASHALVECTLDAAGETGNGWTITAATPEGKIASVTIHTTGTDHRTELRLDITHDDAAWTLEDAELVFSISGVRGEHLYWPDGLGTRYTNLLQMKPLNLNYPSGRGTMSWCAAAGDKCGWYIGRHDGTFSALHLRARSTGTAVEISVLQKPWLKKNERWASPPIVIRSYVGDWTEAAKTYRAWADTWYSRTLHPQWTREQSGWMLAILKQQNGEIFWSYRDLSRVWDIAQAHGLTAVGLFGWAHGGHDRYYPDFIPDPALGGEDELRKALAEAKKRGLRTILYANGQLIDTATEFYRWQGNSACAWKANHEPYVQSIRKFDSSTPVAFALACQGSKVWQEKMRSLAMQAERLGADGILYDQIGVGGTNECHHPGHGHKNPNSGWAEERVAFYAALAAGMHRINPEFTIMTEGVFDALTPHMGWFHGWGTGFAPRPIYEFLGDGASDFPQLFRTVFPEVPLMQRFSTPILGREHANHALLYGLDHEIESRWAADVRYLEAGESPGADAYADCTYYPPDDELMRSVTSADGRKYLKSLCTFVNTHADLLRRGAFTGTDDVTGTGGLPFTIRRSGTLAGVVVVNNGTEPRSVDIRMRGKAPSSAHQPDGNCQVSDPLPPNSVRLYRFSGV
ncbi:MAG: hypothetical protein HZC28_00585 [Spirochaetes bacterium]|nr:hypothetical protein [Spirochaetota bacterium]